MNTLMLTLALALPVSAFASPAFQANCDGHIVQIGTSFMNVDGHTLKLTKLPFGVITGGPYLKPGISAYSDGAGNYYRTSFLLNRDGDKVTTILVLNAGYGVPMATWACN